jgi:hypothetical protein
MQLSTTVRSLHELTSLSAVAQTDPFAIKWVSVRLERKMVGGSVKHYYRQAA